MRRTYWITLALAAAILGWYYTRRADTPQFVTAPSDRGDIRSVVTANGTLGALVTVQVGTQVSGNIKTLYADFNTPVKKGQILAQIDPEPFQARVAQAQSAVANARAEVNAATAAVKKAETDISAARAEAQSQHAAVAAAEVSEADSERKYEARQQAGDVFSAEDVGTAEATYRAAQAGREAAEAQEQASEETVASVQDERDTAQAQVDSSQAQVKQAAAALEQARLDLEHTRILSPIDGVVIARNVDVGQTVAASFQTPTLFQIAQDLSKMQVDMNVDESDVGRLAVGQSAEFTVDALPGWVFQATLQQVRKAPINVDNVITYDAVLSVTKPDPKLFPGMTATVHILEGVHSNALRVPTAALRYRPAGAAFPAGQGGARGSRPVAGRVFVVDAKGKPAERRVTTGFSDANYTEITSGDLREGDRMALSEKARTR